MIKVLMICHGNICRSTMAEFVLKDLVKKNNLTHYIQVQSAGTSQEEIGGDIHYGTKNQLDKHHIAYTKRQAVQVTKADYLNFDFLICMDQNNIYNLQRIIPTDPEHKISKLLSFSKNQGDIADPWYTGDFDTTYQQVLAGCQGLLNHLVALLAL